MKKNILLLLLTIGVWQCALAQVVTTNQGSGLTATYESLSAAITALNAATITAPVTITLTASNPQTAPAGGYNITATGTATNTITITGNSNTITAPAQTSGSLTDAIFKIVGGDFITIQGFTMQENVANTTTTAGTNNMTEFGVALFYATATNGAQNCTIQNNTITLNRTYQNTFGIYSNSSHSSTSITVNASATSAAGSNSGLKVYGNTIRDINIGLVVVGANTAANFNTGIDIGGTASGTGNTISNFGTTGSFSGYLNVSGTINGILVRNSTGFNVSYNSITSSNGGVSASTTLRGVFIQSASAAPTGTFTNNINNNTIALTHGHTSGAIEGITVENTTGTATSTQNINNNNFTALRSSALSTSGTIIAISNVMPNLVNNFNGNTFTNITSNTTASFTFFAHSYNMPAGGSQTIDGNSIVTAFRKTGAGGTVAISTSAASSPNGSTHTFTNNNFSNITVTGATTLRGVNNSDGSGGSATRTVTGNTFNNWTGGTNAITVLSYAYIGGTTSSVSNNIFTNITGQGAITCITIGASANLANTLNVANNTINNLSSTGTGGQVLGISCTNTSTTININGNAINTLSSTGANSAVGGILIGGAATTNIFSNTIFGITSSSAGSPLLLGISVQGGATFNIFQNKIYGFSASGAISTANPAVIGINVTAGTNVNTHNNLIGDLTAPAASLADAIRGININSTTATSNQRVYYNTINLNATSSGANFGSTGLYHSQSATGTTAALDMRNNIIVNASVANGSGLSVAFRRSAAGLENYTTTSNNNLFFGTSGVYYDGAATYAFGPFKTLVSTRETASKFQNPTFASTTGADAAFLHFVADAANLAGANGQAIDGYTTDFDNDTRDASTPDIGADEWVNGVIPLATITSFTPSTLCLAGGQTVTITGTGLSTATSVLFNSAGGVDLAGVITAATETTLTVTTPANTVDGIISVINPSGSANSSATFATAAAPTLGVSSAVTICSGTNTTLTASGANTYSWSPSSGLSATTGASVTASPTATTTYTITGTSAVGCTATNTIVVTVNPTPTAVTVSKVPTIACLGGTTTLTATGGLITAPGTATIGTATTVTIGESSAPTAFNNRFKHYWMQMVFTPAELNAAGIMAGNITAVKFTITTLGDAANVTDLKVRMGTSSSATLSVFQPNGLTLVKTSSTYTHAVGVNTLTFDVPYAWDGVSNLLFDLRSTGADRSNNANTYFTATTGNTVVSATTSTPSSSDGFAATSPNAIPSNHRLNTTFECAVFSPAVISWSPTTDLFTDAAATVDYAGTDVRTVYSKSTTAQTYSASATLGSCTATSADITVTPNPLPTISVASVSICNGRSTPLTASGATTYVWSPATGLSATTGEEVTASPAVTTEYTITGTNSNGCINTTTATVTVLDVTTWNGTAWTNCVPSSTIDAIIASNTAPASFTCKNLTINSTFELNTTGITATVHGNIINSGNGIAGTGGVTLAANSVLSGNAINFTGTLTLNGSTAQTLNANAATVQNLTIDNAAGVSLTGALNITGILTPTAGVLTTGGFLTLKSDANGTASIASNLSGSTYISGNVTVERFIPNSGRKWHLLTTPVSGPTIRQAFAAGTTPNTNAPSAETNTEGGGTLITGHAITSSDAAATAGFDWNSTTLNNTSSSMRYYSHNGNTDSWSSELQTPSPSALASSQQGYIVYIQGDRTVGTQGSSTTALFRPTGTLRQGTQPGINILPTSVSANPKYVVIGNPYASPINFETMVADAGNAAAISSDRFVTWDPTQGIGGVFVLVLKQSGGVWNRVPTDFGAGISNAQHIQSGQAFLVAPTAAGGTLTLQESFKSNPGSFPNILGPLDPALPSRLNINLMLDEGSNTYMLADGVSADFNTSNSLATTDLLDVLKTSNLNENLALERDSKNLVVEALPDPSAAALTLNLAPYTLTNRNYAFQVKSDNVDETGLLAKLVDAYTGIETDLPLDGTVTTYQFTTTGASNDPSKSLTRFKTVVGPITLLPISFTNAQAFAEGTSNKVSWRTGNETRLKGYEVEKSADGRSFGKASNLITAQGNAANSYNWLDGTPTASSYYRIKAIGTDGKATYSPILKVSRNNTGITGLGIYPNPIKGKTLQLQLNNTSKGNYTLSIINATGQQMEQRSVNHNGGSATQSITLSKQLAAGMYRMVLTGTDGKQQSMWFSVD